MIETHLSNVRFADLPLSEPVQKGLSDSGFEFCTPIQSQTLPLALAGEDVAGQGQTGTGKTAAFLLAIFQQLLSTPAPTRKNSQDPRAIILAPTRELVCQIEADAHQLGQHTELTVGVAYGGVDYQKQRDHLSAGVDILIGTPGRLIDFYKQRVFGLKSIQVLVLDEADRMFDLGFIKDIRYVLRRLPNPTQRLNLLFSATLSHRVTELAYEHMNSPELIRVEPEKVTADKVSQRIYFPSNLEKLPLLVGLLRSMDPSRTMIFVNTKRMADTLASTLSANGFQSCAISGDVAQKKRQSMLKSFQEGKLPILIGTDVASRGLHIPAVSHVFNFDLPQDPEDYVHRIGRTARAGASGEAISFGCEDYVINLPAIEEYIGAKIQTENIDRAQLPEITRPPRRKPKKKPPTNRRRGRRKPAPKSG